MELKKPESKIIFPVLAVMFLAMILASYLALTYRHVDATVSLASAPLPSQAKPLHHGLAFRVAFAPMLSPVKSFKLYQNLADRLALEFDMPLELLTRDTYSEVNELLHKGEVDLAFVGTGGFVSDPEDMDVIAAPVVDGKQEYHALIIVPADSTAQALSDLRDGRFLFIDPDSNAGYWYVKDRLAEMGETPESFFGKVLWTGSHDRSILAVSQHLAEGACVESIIFNKMAREDRNLGMRVRILERSPSYPSPPVVVRKTMPISQRHRLLGVLLELPQSASGRAILDEIGMDGFEEARNSDYSEVKPPGGTP